MSGSGYGSHRVPGEGRFAQPHRTAFEAFYGPIPEGKHILHLCDNRTCYNPIHLALGDAKANAADRESKGRGRYGINAPGIYGKSAA